MFVFDGGLKLHPSGVAVDFRQRQPRGFISHAHGDHLARHELAYCTSATAALYHHRVGRRPVRTLDYGEPLELDGTRLTTLPAGHMLGSAMLLAEHSGTRLLYTGDFQLEPPRTATATPRLPQADVLVMESTFGEPRWTLPDRQQTEASLLELIDDCWRRDRVPVVFAYATGKSQEMVALLAEHGRTARQHPKIASISEVYRTAGCDLPPPQVYDGSTVDAGEVVLLPPRRHRASFLPCPRRSERIAVTGWGLDPRARHRLEVDHVVPLSDHADFPQLLECVRQVRPRVVFCTHGPPSWVDQLRQRGWDAHPLDDHAPAKAATI